jgi:hypothetical protein
MFKRFISVTLIIVICLSMSPGALSAGNYAEDAAKRLYDLRLFQGVGTGTDGSPDFALNNAPTRAQAVAMLVRLLGKQAEAYAGNWEIPFTDVSGWSEPYIGYAFANGLVFGIDETTFDSSRTVTASAYITMVLRALGYSSDTDFVWSRAWILSDELGLTDRRYNSTTTVFLRGDVAEISFNALTAKLKGSDATLYSVLIDAGAFTRSEAIAAGLFDCDEMADPYEDYPNNPSSDNQTPTSDNQTPGASAYEREVFDLVNKERALHGLSALEWCVELAEVARDHSTDMMYGEFFAHVTPDGRTPGDRVRAAGLSFTFVGENLGRGYRTPEAVVLAWMNSPGHRSLILHERPTLMGVGLYYYHWTLKFLDR